MWAMPTLLDLAINLAIFPVVDSHQINLYFVNS
jgi:hypothetical protein